MLPDKPALVAGFFHAFDRAGGSLRPLIHEGFFLGASHEPLLYHVSLMSILERSPQAGIEVPITLTQQKRTNGDNKQ
ncbi:MAG: hypothetical protein FNT29_09930 [Halothiobacillaceae bacterium]|jgi:hypothetical protein|nr:MAG: hypothetical protein FNT29_09930 [Halothiobacillaceae bacterium]